MKRILLFLLPLLFLFACSNKKGSPKLFTPEVLANQLFNIDASKDTLLQTLHGSVIRIMAGSFSASGSIRVEIREAFTPAEILAAGMITESNTRLLRSGGMIYINAKADGKIVGLIKPIKVSIPNNYYDSAMQVFKGITSGDSLINWAEPQPVDSTPQSKNWKRGKMLFRKSCAQCHTIFKDGTGPRLMNIENRGPWTDRKNIYSFINNVPEYIHNNKYVNQLFQKFGSMMQSFKMSNEDIDAILDYIKNETEKGPPEEEGQPILNTVKKDSSGDRSSAIEMLPDKKPCPNDTIYLSTRENDITLFDTIAIDPPPSADLDTSLRSAESAEGLRRGFTDPNPTRGMYDFEIKTLGWYNIDAYIEGYDGTRLVQLSAQLRVEFSIDMHVYLFCPRNKTLSVAYEHNNNTYVFKKISGRIPLFLNEKSILFAFGSKGDKMYYGISEFNVRSEQTIQVTIKETTEEEIRNALFSKQIDGIDFGMDKKEMKVIENMCDPKPTTDSTAQLK
jgi:cytochrome c2